MRRNFPSSKVSNDHSSFPSHPRYGSESTEAPLLLTVKEAAALMRIGRDTTYSLVAQRRIPCVKLGKQIRIPRKALIAHLEKEAIQQAFNVDEEAG